MHPSAFWRPLLVLLAVASGITEAASQQAPAAGQQGSATVADLRHGGSLRGQFRPVELDRFRGQEIYLDDGLRLVLPDVEFRRFRGPEERMVEYRSRLATLDDTADAHMEISRWCNSVGLRDQKDRHLRRVIELAPNDATARQELGYMPFENGWVKIESLRRKRGMLRDGGRWRFAEEVLNQGDSQDFEQQRKDWIKKLNGIKMRIRRGGVAGNEAQAELMAIDDPAADEAIVKEFRDTSNYNTAMRRQWLRIMARLNTGLTTTAIIQSSMNDVSATIQEDCLDLLRGEHKFRAMAYYLNHLGSNDNAVVSSAGRALAEINDPEIALVLVEALVTEHTTISQPGNDTNVGMSRDGSGPGGGMQFGGKAQKITRSLENPEILTALLELVPDDVNYMYDEERWRNYFAMKMAPPPGDLRRDP
ncbi:hypothetical protein SH139x_005034 [Planctomycetaceae bacterium SH139]